MDIGCAADYIDSLMRQYKRYRETDPPIARRAAMTAARTFYTQVAYPNMMGMSTHEKVNALFKHWEDVDMVGEMAYHNIA